MFTIPLQRDSPTPLYQQLFESLRARIQSGEIKAGSRLPSSRVLAQSLGVSRVSVTTAYDRLENAGLVHSKDRRGLYVAHTGHAALSASLPALFDGDFAANSPKIGSDLPFPARISFSMGSLPAEFMPVQAMREALNHVLDRDAGAALGYEPTEGYPPLRTAIAESVHGLGIAVTGDQVLVTGGTQQAIDLAVQSIVPPGGVILTTDPTYIGLIDIARARRLSVIAVPYTADGLDFDGLECAIEQHHPSLFYLMTTFHNPTGAVLSTGQRRRLLALSERWQVPILEDGVYDGLSYDGAPGLPLKALDTGDNVLYASGFSKTVVPGTRIGYLISGQRHYGQIVRVKQAADVCTPGLNQRAMTELLRSGALAAHLERVRHACKRRRDAMLAALQREAGETWRWSLPGGGLYLWLELPNGGLNAAELLQSATGLGVDFALGVDFSPTGRWSHHLRLNFTTHAPTVIEEGVRRLWAAYR